MLIACRFFLRHNVHRRCLSGNLTIVPVGIWSWFCYTSTCTCMPLEQFDHVSSSTMSCNVRDNYFVGKTHLEIWKCLFINLLLIYSLYSIDTCILASYHALNCWLVCIEFSFKTWLEVLHIYTTGEQFWYIVEQFMCWKPGTKKRVTCRTCMFWVVTLVSTAAISTCTCTLYLSY